MIQEFEQVVFTVDLPEYRLLAGDVEMVADIHPSGKAYEVEVFRVDGSTLGVFTIKAGQIRSATKNEVVHARAIAPTETTTHS